MIFPNKMPKIIRLKVEDDFPGGLSLRVDASSEGNLSDLFHDGFFVADQFDRRDVFCGVGAIGDIVILKMKNYM